MRWALREDSVSGEWNGSDRAMSRNPIYIKLINTTRWRKLRAKKMRANPICELCDERNRSTLATEVHHVVPCETEATERGIEGLMFHYMNLQSLCHECHKEVHKSMRSQSWEAVQENNKRSTERFIDRFLK